MTDPVPAGAIRRYPTLLYPPAMEPFCLLSCPVSRPHQIPETSTAATLREVRIGSRSRSRRSHIEQVRTSPSGPWQAWKNSLTSPQDPSCPRRARRDSEAALTRRSLRLASCHVHLVLVLAVAPRIPAFPYSPLIGAPGGNKGMGR